MWNPIVAKSFWVWLYSALCCLDSGQKDQLKNPEPSEKSKAPGFPLPTLQHVAYGGSIPKAFNVIVLVINIRVASISIVTIVYPYSYSYSYSCY